MIGWLAVVGGFALVAALLAIVVVWPHSTVGSELRRTYQVQTTGVLGRFSAKDFVRAAMLSFFIGAVLLAGSIAAFTVSFGRRGVTARLLEGYGFGLLLLSAVVLLSIGRTLYRGGALYLQERRVARERHARHEQFEVLRELLIRYDPMELADLNQPAEYDYQAGRLLLSLRDRGTYDEVLAAVHGQFGLWFPGQEGPAARYAALAQEIWLRVSPSGA